MYTAIIPTPKKYIVRPGKALITGVSTKRGLWSKQAEAFRSTLSRTLGKSFGEGNVFAAYDEGLEAGAYRVKGENCAVTVTASDEKGVCNGFAAVLQLALENGGYVPCCSIEDKPDCSYRGMMVDLARTWHPFSYLLSYVDLCAYYRMSTLHLHFTDSQSYTLPSKAFPRLSSVDRHYSFEEIAYLNEYAAARGIQIMPEIDVPGHSDPFAQNYPGIFGNNGIIGFSEGVFAAFDVLLTELCAMFPNSRNIHIGGDEAAIGKWLEVEEYREYARKLGIFKDGSEDDGRNQERMLAVFVQKLADIVIKNGRTPMVWEGFAKDCNYLVSKDIIVFSWENYYQTTPDLVDYGYTLINGSWNPMYVVHPVVCWPQSDCYDWDIYTFKPVHGGSPYIKTGLKIEPYDKMIGGQLLAWGDRLPADRENLDTERNKLAERLAAAAQNTWNVQKLFGYDEFRAQYDRVKQGSESLIKLHECSYR